MNLQLGEREITVTVARTDRIAGGVSIEFREVTSPNSAIVQCVHLSKDEAEKLLLDLKEILT